MNRRKIFVLSGLALLLAVAALRLALPHWIENKVRLGLGDSGRIQGVGLSLWRLAYQYQGLEFFSRGAAGDAPTFFCQEVDIALNWRAFFSGSLMATVTLEKPLLNLFTPYAGALPARPDAPYWSESVKGLVPFTIDHIDIRQGELHFRDPGNDPQIDLHLNGIEINAANFSGQNSGTEKFPGSIRASATAMSEGSASLKGRFDPSAAVPTFEYEASLWGLELRALNPLLLRYAGLDLHAGSLDLDYQAAASDGNYRGSVISTFKGLKVMKPEEKFRPAKMAKKAFVGSIGWILKDPKGQLESKAKFAGVFSDPAVIPLRAALELFSVAFFAALPGGE